MIRSRVLGLAGVVTAVTSIGMAGLSAAPALAATTTAPTAPTASSAPNTTTPSTASPVPTSSTTPKPASADMDSCPSGKLPALIEGAPASYHAGDSRGAWIWHGKSGYAIRVTHSQDGHLVAFTGTVTATQPIQVKGVQLEANDHYWLSADHKTLYFAFSNKGYTDGIDFVANCAARVSFNVRADGAELSAAKVHLGAHAVAALSNPFTVERRK